MTVSPEARPSDSPPEIPCGARWREREAVVQERALAGGSTVVCCSARPGSGGLGRHLSEILAALERGGHPHQCISGATRQAAASGARAGLAAGRSNLAGLLAATPLARSPGIRTRAFMVEFDTFAAGRLTAVEHLIAFNGQALRQLRAARRAGYESVALVSANSHLRHVARQHARALARHPLERSWTTHLVARNEREYGLADRIYWATSYIRDSFLAAGVAEERLARFPLTPDPRYRPVTGTGASAEGSASQSFEVVYVGSLAVHKGVPLLIDAFRRLPHRDMRLVLVGGWGARGMRRFVQGACAADPRIVAGPGDPLPSLRRASVCVHAAYEDGFGYAPAEALACGVPLLVSEDTGMKELIDSPRAGLILPTGDLDALSEAIDAAYRGEIFGG
ncbi:MAG TPA: glycosyltransferase family 4 protein [Solirubrobacteraceae bacterium]|nr:glycosyltransferase family 4 protein [Solirubrobacteraceae bacterium]